MNAKELLESIFANHVRAEDLPPGDDLRFKATRIGDLFTACVDFLWHHFPSPVINARAAVLWELVGSKRITFAMGPPVPSLSLLGTSTVTREEHEDPRTPFTRTIETAAVLAPTNWLELCQEEPYMQLGAIVHLASKATDVLNEKPVALFEKRALVYEAEYLCTLLRTKTLTLNELNAYQKHVLEKHPQGVDTPNALSLVYDSKPI